MKKTVRNDEVYYTLYWSRPFEYDRISATRILPELPGIIWIQHKSKGKMETDIFFACWRDGCRVGLKKLLDEIFTQYNDLREKLLENDIYYRYTIIDTNPRDMQDIMYWLIREHNPALNDRDNYTDSKRFKNIFIKEHDLPENSIAERR